MVLIFDSSWNLRVKKILPNFEPKNRASRQILRMRMPFLHKFITLKELTAEELTDSSWNMFENIKRLRERDFLHLKHLHFWIYCLFSVTSSPKVNLLPHFWTLQYFKRWQSLEPPGSTLGRDSQMHPLTFLYRIQCSTTFI